MNILVRKQSSTAICKIYDFEYVTHAHMQFVKTCTHWTPTAKETQLNKVSGHLTPNVVSNALKKTEVGFKS